MDQLKLGAVFAQEGDRADVRPERRHPLIEDDFGDLIAGERHG